VEPKTRLDQNMALLLLPFLLHALALALTTNRPHTIDRTIGRTTERTTERTIDRTIDRARLTPRPNAYNRPAILTWQW
jgi:hypothetical protein